MKKILTVILAVLLIATCVPIAFAAECEHQYDAQSLVRPNILGDGYYICPLCKEQVTLKRADYSGFDEHYVTVTAYGDHVYASEEIDAEVYTACEEFWDKFLSFVAYEEGYENENGEMEYYETVEFSIFNIHEGEQESLDELTAMLIVFEEKIEDILSKYENAILFDGTDFAKAEYELNLISACYTEDEFNAAYENITFRNPEEIIKTSQKYIALEEKLNEDRYSVTKEEYDEAMSGMADYFISLANCIAEKHNYGAYNNNGDGTHKAECGLCIAEKAEEHIWNEYIYNGDATEESDGTKTASCTACDAKNTVTAEGTKLPVDEVDPEPTPDGNPTNFLANFIQTIRNFFASIMNFFKNLLK